MTGRLRGRIFLIASFACWLTAESLAQQYSMKALGVGPPGGEAYYNYTTPKINNGGQVVGNSYTKGYYYGNGALTWLAAYDFTLDLSNSGIIATFDGSDSYLYGAPPYTSQTDVGSLTGCVPGPTPITAINDAGAAVGISNAATTCPQPFLFSNGHMTSLGGSSPVFEWLAINNSNQIVGYAVNNGGATRAMQLVNGTFADLDPSNATLYDSEAQAINDAGEFVVNSNEAFCSKKLGPPSFKTITVACRGANWYPLLYNGSTVTTLPVLGPYGGTAAAINYFGDVVGASETATGVSHGFINLYGSTFDLNAHPLTNGTGWTILQAYDINDNGQIVALGKGPSGNQDVVILTPQIVKQPPPVGLSLRPSIQPVGIATVPTLVGTVTLESAAPAGGTIVYLSSSNPLVRVPAKIRVAPKSTTGTFKIKIAEPVGSVDVTFFATSGVMTKATTLKVSDNGY